MDNQPRTVYAIYDFLSEGVYEMQPEWHATLEQAIESAAPGNLIGEIFDPDRFSNLYIYKITKRLDEQGVVEDVNLAAVPHDVRRYRVEEWRLIPVLRTRE